MYNSKTITREQLCRLFDHTLVKPFATDEDYKKLCQEAAENHFAMVALDSGPVELCAKYLKGTDVHVGGAVAFPTGNHTLECKLFEEEDDIKKGADEIDYIIHIRECKNHNWEYMYNEMKAITDMAKSHGLICKALFENCYLTPEEIAKMSQIARDVEPTFIKTSTGMGTYGARLEDIKIMKENCGDKVKVKAAGGVRTWEFVAQLLDAGVERIGTSSAFKILEEFDAARAAGK